jgi:hypothetical protein
VRCPTAKAHLDPPAGLESFIRGRERVASRRQCGIEGELRGEEPEVEEYFQWKAKELPQIALVRVEAG